MKALIIGGTVWTVRWAVASDFDGDLVATNPNGRNVRVLGTTDYIRREILISPALRGGRPEAIEDVLRHEMAHVVCWAIGADMGEAAANLVVDFARAWGPSQPIATILHQLGKSSRKGV